MNKIPDEILLRKVIVHNKELEKIIDTQIRVIEDLRKKLSKCKPDLNLTKEDWKEIRKDKRFTEYKNKIDLLNIEVKRLRSDNNNLITQLVQLRK